MAASLHEDLVEPSVQGGDRSRPGPVAIPSPTCLDEDRGDRSGEDRDERHADDHHRRPDETPDHGLRDRVTVADRRDRLERVPQRATQVREVASGRRPTR